MNKTPGLYFEIQVIFGLLTLLTAFFSANTEVQEVNKNNLLQILLPTLYCYMTPAARKKFPSYSDSILGKLLTQPNKLSKLYN